MKIYLWIIYIIVALISLYPVTKLSLFNISKRYSYFKYVSILLLVWTIITGLRYVVVEPYIQYYLALSIYPLIFLLTGTLLMAILKYLDRNIPKFFKWLFIILFVIYIGVSFTNNFHYLMLEVPLSTDITFDTYMNAQHGLGFFIHTILNYVLLFIIIGLIIQKLYKNVRLDQDVFPFIIMIIGITGGISLNMIHVFFYSFVLDPTYIAFVLIIMLLYYVMYMRDLKLILEEGRNNFIIDNLREMYVIVNQRDEIVDASEEFIKYFDLNIDNHILFNDVLINILDRAVIFTDPKDLKMEFEPSKRYLHMQMKLINIPYFKYSGKFYMFYDETEHQKYINDMNYIKSHDLMTKLFNRNYIEEIKYEIDNANQSYALIMFDLDGLKLYNDYLGHEAGDNLLISFADRLKTIADKYSLIPIRMGGDEFLLIAMNMNQKMINSTMDDIISIVNENSDGEELQFSYGYAERETSNEKLEKVLSRADNIMYQMKLKNRDSKTSLLNQLKSKANKKA